MKLPEGKITDTQTGGVEDLKNMIEKLKEDNLTGYLLIKKKEEDTEQVGQIVYKDGEPVLSEFIGPKKTVSGPDSVISIIESTITDEATFEVHTNIDVELMIRFFSKAKIGPKDLNIDKKLDELRELEEKEKEKTVQLKKELEIRKVLEEKLKKWKNDGYIVAKLEKIWSDDLDKVQPAFEEFEEGVDKLHELDERLSSIENEEFTSNKEEIEGKLNNVDKISEIESDLNNLEQMISEQDEKRNELRKIVQGWKDEAYNVTELLDMVESDVNKAWDEFTTVMDTIQKLKEYEELINNIKGKAFKNKVESLNTKIKDITALDDVKKEYAVLEGLLKEESEKKERLKVMMNSWSEQGFKVDSLNDVLDEAFDIAEEKFIDFEKKIETLKELKGRLENVDKSEFEGEINKLSKKLNDPASADELAEAVSELEKRAEEVTAKKESLRQLSEDLKAQGYDVSDLESALQGKVDDAIAKFEEFEDKKKQIDNIKKELAELDTRDFPEETEQITANLTDFSAIEEMKSLLADLKEKISANEEQRQEIINQINNLKEEGFVITRIEQQMNDSYNSLRDAFIAFLDDIQKLKDLKSNLSELSAPGYEDDVKALEELLNDTENLSRIEESINNIKEKVEKEKERRKEIKNKISAWKKEGFEISQMEEKLEAPLPELESAFSEINQNMEKLKTFGEQLASLDVKWHEEEAGKIKELLKNPEAISEIGKIMAELVDTLDKEQQERRELKDQLERWREEGYNVSSMDSAMDQSIDKIKEAADTLNEQINNLKGIGKKLDALDLKWFEKEAEAIREQLKDYEKLEEATKAIDELAENIETTKKQREELKSKYDDWNSQGFNVEPLDEVLDKELSEMKSAFETFEKDLQQLLELQKKMGIKSPSYGDVKEKRKEMEPEKEKVDEEKEEEPEAQPKEKPKKAGDKLKEKVTISGMDLIPEFVFDTFVVGASNRFTHAAALAVAETPAEAYNPLFIYGGVGLGKTHLLNAIGNHILEAHKNSKVVYTSSEKFTNELINSIRYDTIEEFRKVYRAADVLIIDDIQFLAGKESTQEEFFHTFNALYTAHKQIVITSDRPPRDIPQLEERLKSRFEGGLITDIQPPSLETKIIILRREAKKENIDIPDEVMHIIASKVKSNIRELRGALTKIVAYSKLVKQEITEDLTKEVLKDFIGEKPTSRIPVADTDEPIQPSPKPREPVSVSSGLSSIEKRLSSLKKKLSPILKSGGVEKKKVEPEEEVEAAVEPPAKEPEEAAAEVEAALEEPEEEPIPKAPEPEAGDEEGSSAESEVPATANGEVADSGEEEVELAKCGNCGELIPGTAIECPNCGVSFADETYECPMCRAIVSIDSSRCENCGAEFEIVDEEEQPPDEDKKKKKKKKK